nr:hypothetical protein [Lachnospiraceae bacterium]
MNQNKSNRWLTLLLIIVCIALNFMLNKLVIVLNLPLYFDTVGTILGTMLGGMLPGVAIALATNFIAGITSFTSIYFAVLNVLIAVATGLYMKYGYHKKNGFHVIIYILALAFIGGGLGSLLSYYFEGDSIASSFMNLVNGIHKSTGLAMLPSRMLALFLADLFDKTVSVGLVLVCFRVIPADIAHKFEFTGWRQRPLNEHEQNTIDKMKNRTGSIYTKIVSLLVLASVAITLIVTVISIILFRDYARDQYIRMADGVASSVADLI